MNVHAIVTVPELNTSWPVVPNAHFVLKIYEYFTLTIIKENAAKSMIIPMPRTTHFI